LLPPPDTETLDEHSSPGSFDPCPNLRVSPPVALSASAGGTGDPHVTWNEDTDQFLVVWREGGRAMARLLDAEGRLVGLEIVLSGPEERVDGDPVAVGVPGLEEPGYYFALKVGERIELRRFLPGVPEVDRRQPEKSLDEALSTVQRAPSLAWDGERLGIGYQRSDQHA